MHLGFSKSEALPKYCTVPLPYGGHAAQWYSDFQDLQPYFYRSLSRTWGLGMLSCRHCQFQTPTDWDRRVRRLWRRKNGTAEGGVRRANPRQAASPHLRERGSYLLCQIFFVAIKWLKIEVMNWQIGRRRGTSDISKKLLARARIPPVRAHPGQPLSREGPIADNGLNVRPNTLPNIRPIAIALRRGWP